MRSIFIAVTVFTLVLSGCNTSNTKKPTEVIIFHAGSLSVPFKLITADYEKKNPGVKFLLEPAGSLVCARKITELKKPCDIIASADYFVINELIIPDYASWSIRFATNELVISFQEKSKYAEEIDSLNWMDILLREDVTFSRSEPNADPCGYRTVLLFKLAEKYYGKSGLADKLSSKNTEFIRPKEVDLVALVESNAVDYMFQYKSVAVQHKLEYIELPDYINLGNPWKNKIYNSVSLDITGSTPKSIMTVTGEYINYSLTVLKDAPQSEIAVDFISFLLSDEGFEIFRRNGQEPIIPFSTEQPDQIPVQLRKYLKAQIP